MDRHQSFSEVIEGAKQQRAEQIGATIGKHRIAALVVVAIPFMLTQVQWSGSTPAADDPATQSEIVTTSIAPTQLQSHSARSLLFSSIEEAGSRWAR